MSTNDERALERAGRGVPDERDPCGGRGSRPGRRVVLCDNTFVSEASEEADRVRDPSHVRNYSTAEWHSFFELAGLEVADESFMYRPLEIEPWLARVECRGAEAARVRELLGDRVV